MFVRTLSGRFLLLTILFVLLAEVLIFVPSMARFREEYLLSRLERAQIASLALLASAGTISDKLAEELLINAGVYNVVLRRDAVRELVLSSPVPGPANVSYDMRAVPAFILMRDALAVAKRQGRLHRNFQGYSTQPDCDLIALGVSAIGRVGATYSQNAKTLEEYYDLLDQGRLPVVRGLAVTRDDLVRRAVIMALMCQGEVQFESIELSHLIDFASYFASELVALKELESQGLVVVGARDVQVTPNGWFFVRAIAMVFDRYLQADRTRAKFSKIL